MKKRFVGFFRKHRSIIEKMFPVFVFFFLLGLLVARANAQTTAYGFDIVPSDFEIEVQDVIDVAKAVLAGLAGMWGWRKVVKSMNRS